MLLLLPVLYTFVTATFIIFLIFISSLSSTISLSPPLPLSLPLSPSLSLPPSLPSSLSLSLSPSLYIEKLPKHPEYSKAPATERQRVKTLVKSSFDQALLCKKRLKEKYTQEKELYIQRRESEVNNDLL